MYPVIYSLYPVSAALPTPLTVHQHHCRACGKIFCSKCSDKECHVKGSKKPVRVCTNCYKVRPLRYRFVDLLTHILRSDLPPVMY